MKNIRIALTILTLMALLAPATLVGAQGPDDLTRVILPRDHDADGEMISLLSATATQPSVDYMGALALGAERLLALQADVTEDNAGNGDPDADQEDGGWDWAIDPSITEHGANPSPENTYGVTAMGLLGAYLTTGDARYRTALQDAYMGMAARPGVDSCGDFRFLAMLTLFTGDPGPAALAKARYDAKKVSYGSAAAWAEAIRDNRNSQGYASGIIPWDIGLCIVDAAALSLVFPSESYGADADAMAEVIYEDMYNDNPGYFDETDGTEWWWTLGMSGALWAFRAADVHAAEREQLAQTLIDYQNDGATKAPAGAWDWNDDYGGGDYQTTAYVVLALMTYATDEARAAAMAGIDWLVSEQRPNGSWYLDGYDEYTEEEGEVLSAIALALGCRYEEPTAITLASFTAEADAEGVDLAWETATEVDNAGFNLYRATSPGGPYTKINDTLIGAHGDPVSGASYGFVDTPGYGVFYYKLEDVDYNGVSTLHGPLEVVVARPFRRPLRRPLMPMLD